VSPLWMLLGPSTAMCLSFEELRASIMLDASPI